MTPLYCDIMLTEDNRRQYEILLVTLVYFESGSRGWWPRLFLLLDWIIYVYIKTADRAWITENIDMHFSYIPDSLCKGVLIFRFVAVFHWYLSWERSQLTRFLFSSLTRCPSGATWASCPSTGSAGSATHPPHTG